jgi:transposase
MAENQEHDVTIIKERVCIILEELKRQLTSDNLRQDVLDYISTSQLFNVGDRLFACISEAQYLVSSACDTINGTHSQPEKYFTGNRGRPSYNITREQIEYFIDYGFKAGEIATLLGVSVATVRRRLQDFELSTSVCFTPLSDEQLDEVVKDIKRNFVQSGYRMVLGLLRSRGFRIQESRVMESLRRVDVEGVIMRSLQLKTINRREYKVYGPNALWHIDTNHKLIR